MVERIDIEWFETRPDAISAEERAIKNERPMYNQTHNDGVRKWPAYLVIADTFMRVSDVRRSLRK